MRLFLNVPGCATELVEKSRFLNFVYLCRHGDASTLHPSYAYNGAQWWHYE